MCARREAGPGPARRAASARVARDSEASATEPPAPPEPGLLAKAPPGAPKPTESAKEPVRSRLPAAGARQERRERQLSRRPPDYLEKSATTAPVPRLRFLAPAPT